MERPVRSFSKILGATLAACGAVLSLFLFSGSIAFASTSGITYHGRVLKPDGTPLEGQNVQFKLQVRTPDASNCLLFEETKTLNMKGSVGVFDLTLNDGTGNRTDTTGLSLDIIFANRGSMSGTNCTIGPGTYLPGVNDGRRFQVSFKDENMTSWEPLPAQNLNFIPLAIEAKQVGGFTPLNLLRVEDAGGPGAATAFTTPQFNELYALSNGTSTNYLRTSSSTAYVPTRAGAPTSPVAGQFWFDTGSSQLKYYDGATTQTLASGGSLPALPSGTIWVGNGSNAATSVTASGDATLSSSGVIALKATGTAGSYFKVTTDAQGRVTSGAAALLEADIPTLSTAGKVAGSAITGTIGGAVVVNTTGTITASSLSSTTDSTQNLWLYEPTNTSKVVVKAPASLTGDYTLTLPATPGTSGYVLTTNGSGVLSWTASSSGSVTSVTGTAPVSVGGTAAAPVVSMAQATGSVPGYLSAADFTTFNGKLSGSLVDGKIYVGNAGTASAVTPSGDATMTNTGIVTVGKIQGRAVAATTPVTSQVLRYNTATATWEVQYLNITDLKKSDGTTQFQSASCAAGQTLTWSVLTDLFTCATISITKSQVSDLGTIGTAAALNAGIAANNVVQLDSSGKLPAVDGSALTNLSPSNFGSGIIPVVNGGTGTATGSITGTTALTFAAGGSNQNVTLIPSGTGATVLGGKVGIGTTVPAGTLDVQGGTAGAGANGVSISLNAQNAGSGNQDGGSIELTPGTATGTGVTGGVNVNGTLNVNPSSALLETSVQSFSSTYSSSNFDSGYFATSVFGSPGANSTFNGVHGVSSFFGTANAPSTSVTAGVTGSATTMGAFNPYSIVGGNFSVSNLTGTGTTTAASAITGGVTNFSSGTITSAYGLNIASPAKYSTGGITTYYGVYIGTPTVAGTNYSVYAPGGKNYFGGNVGIGTTSPGAPLDVKGAIRLSGATSGYTGFQPAAVAGSTVWTLPSTDGSSGQVLSTNGVGLLAWATPGGGGTVTGVTATAPIVSSGGTAPVLSMAASTTSVDGYLKATDFTIFSAKAPTVSPTFTGVPLAPTAAANTSTTQLATTAFVLGQASSTTPLMDGTAAIGTGTTFARADHVHPSDTTRAPAAGSASITTLGTVTSGIWNASIIGVPYGGTGTATGSITGTGPLVFAAGGTNSNVTLTPSGTGSTILGGSVGIGTSAPSTNLSVISTGSTSMEINSTANSANAYLYISGRSAGVSKTVQLTSSTSGDFTVQPAIGASTTIKTGAGTSAVFVDGSGNVGIGTTSPGAPLDVKGALRLSGATSGYTGFQPAAVAGSTVWTLPATDGSSNQVLTTNGSGILSWSSPAGTGVSSVAVTAPITNGGTATAPNIGIPAATTSVDGYLKATDWTIFNGKQSSTLANGSLWIGNASNVATAVALSGDTTVTNAGVVTVGKIQNRTIASTTPVTSQYMRYNTATTSWEMQYMNVADLKKSDGTTQFQSASCSAGQTLTWSLITDLFTCTTISITKAQVSNLGTIGTAASQDYGTAAGNLVQLDAGAKIPAALLPTGAASQWTTAGSDIYYATGKVGIGTSSPTASLEVNAPGNAAFLSPASFMAPANTGVGNYTEVRVGVAATANNSAEVRFINKGGSGSASNQVQLGLYNNNGLVVDGAGNVGIGTTSPGALLEVAGAVKFGGIVSNGTISASPATAANPNYVFTTDYNTGLYSPSYGALGISTNGAERIRINSAGSVGIGTSAPASNLEIVDTSGSSSPVTVTSYSSSTAGGGGWTGRHARGTAAAPTASINNDRLNALGGAGYNGSAWNSNAAAIIMSATEAYTSSTNNGANITFETTPNGSGTRAERLRIDQNGYVGIGTASPTAPLEVKGAIRLSGATSGYTGFQPAAAAGSTVWTLPTADGATNQVLTTNGSGLLSWSTPAGSGVTGVTATAPVVSSGGTAPVISMPAATASVDGYLKATDFTTFNAKQSSTLTNGSLWIGNASNVATPVALSGDATVTNAGVVTVGKIQNRTVASTAPVTGQYLRYNTATSTWETQYMNVADLKKSDGTTQFQSASCSAGQTLTWSLITDLFTCTTISITKSQVSNLGTIGTAASQDYGTAAGNLVQLDAGAKIPSALLPAGTATQWTTLSSNIYFNSGSVGIGTTSPQSKLDVNGSVRVGTDATSCSGTIQGAIRMNGTALEFCNGTSWLALSTATGSYLSTSGGTLTGGLTISSGNLAVTTGGLTVGAGGIAAAGPISGANSLTQTSGGNVDHSFVTSYVPASAPAAATAIYGLSNGISTAGAANLANATIIGEQSIATHTTNSNLLGGTGTTAGFTNSGTGTVSSANGTYGSVANTSSGTITGATAASGSVLNNSTGAIVGATGVSGQVQNTAGTVTSAYAINGSVANSGAGTIGSAIGIYSTITKSAGTITTSYGVLIDSIAGTNKFGLYQLDSTANNYFAGNVGIGTSNPRAKLDVSGTITSGAAVSNGTTTIDFSTGNKQYTTASCGSFQFNYLKDGGDYVFVVQGATASLCAFTAFSDAGSTPLTVHPPPDLGNTTASKHTMFNISILGTHAYIAWTPGY